VKEDYHANLSSSLNYPGAARWEKSFDVDEWAGCRPRMRDHECTNGGVSYSVIRENSRMGFLNAGDQDLTGFHGIRV